MSDHFTSELRLQLRAAALREERRGRLGRALATLRAAPAGPPAIAAGALAALVLAVVVVIGGLRWGDDRPDAPRVVDSVRLADVLGSVVPGFGAAWTVDAARDEVLRIDPASRRVEARIPVPDGAIVSSGAGGVWVLSAIPGVPLATHVPGERHTLLRIDPASNRVTARVTVAGPDGEPFLANDAVFVDGVPWVLGSAGALRIDPESGRVQELVAIEREVPHPLWMGVAGEELWVLMRDQRLARYDLRTGERGPDVPVRLAGAVGFAPTPAGPLLASTTGELARAQLPDGRLAWERRFGGFPGAAMVLPDEGLVWIHAPGAAGGRNRLVALDLASGATRASVALPSFGASGLAHVGRELWLTTPDGRLVIVRP